MLIAFRGGAPDHCDQPAPASSLRSPRLGVGGAARPLALPVAAEGALRRGRPRHRPVLRRGARRRGDRRRLGVRLVEHPAPCGGAPPPHPAPSIAGALAGGILAVELYRLARGITGSTGVIWVGPLALGIAVGR